MTKTTISCCLLVMTALYAVMLTRTLQARPVASECERCSIRYLEAVWMFVLAYVMDWL